MGARCDVSPIKWFREMKSLLHKLSRKISRLWLRPIRIFVFHHVSDVRDPFVSALEDWTQTDVFYSNILSLRKKYKFISLGSAYKRIKSDRIRLGRYAVLTTDDGLRTVNKVWPWLERHSIPLTCFINAKYLDGHSYKVEDVTRIKEVDPDADIYQVIKRQYMTREQLFSLVSPLISIASHGYEHLNARTLTEDQFKLNVLNCQEVLVSHPCYTPFFAYTWGKHNKDTDRVLFELGLTPVLVDGMKNYNDYIVLHRECIDGMIIK